jgi:hypothetical protein
MQTVAADRRRVLDLGIGVEAGAARFGRGFLPPVT